MIPIAFISRIQQRFSHEKRAQVCLWFDPASEFVRVLPVFSQHLAEMKNPPFLLLAYDSTQIFRQVRKSSNTDYAERDFRFGSLINEGQLSPGSVYTIGTDMSDHRLARFLLQAHPHPQRKQARLLRNPRRDSHRNPVAVL